MNQICKVCGETDQTKIVSNGKKGKRNTCKDCHSTRMRNDYRTLRNLILDAYGRKCAMCGEKHVEFLAIDHINNDGNAHRATIQGNNKGGNSMMIYRDIRNQGFPKDKYQILCHNCNISKQTHSYNPILLERERIQITEGFMGEGI